jgi:hypothetical protein
MAFFRAPKAYVAAYDGPTPFYADELTRVVMVVIIVVITLGLYLN